MIKYCIASWNLKIQISSQEGSLITKFDPDTERKLNKTLKNILFV